ncbi:WhiB family transcription factor [Gordonia phage Sixama]|uniref:WhiB family transcription factor n=1 Tax=Gordonia phage Sixama TaxID=2653271 RepID=A0A5Q2F7X7_9CAUD|nr:transcriptional regulator WhiB-like [Gordonia phage Sixama]QGF20246.1 WhiB family transcription factor [Gordonia phage Sixama]
MVTMTRPLRSEASTASTRVKSFPSELQAFAQSWPKHLPNGLCKNAPDPDIWANPYEDEQLQEAREICMRCPIRDACLEIGVQRSDDGVYGGELLYRGKPDVLPKYRRKK